MKRALAFAVYFLSGLVGAFLTIQLIGAAVWGASVSPLAPLALLADLALIAAAIVGLWAPAVGRNIATGAVALLGLLYLPAAGEIVPGPGETLSLAGVIFLPGFLALAGFVLFFPSRRPYAGRVAVAAAALAAISFGITYCRHWRSGDFNWPAIVAFYERGEGSLTVASDPQARLAPPVLDSLRAAGLGGELTWAGGWTAGNSGRPEAPVILVIVRQPPREEKRLYLPRRANLIYHYDGKVWTTIPAAPELYPTYVTLTTDGMIREESGSAFRIFRWRR